MMKHMPTISPQRSHLRSHHAPRDEQITSQDSRLPSWGIGKLTVGRALLPVIVGVATGKSARPTSYWGRSKHSARHAECDGDVKDVRSRRGFTLFEILLSLGLFLGALAVLSQMWYSGVRASVQSRLRTQAIFRCESKLSEVVAGAVPLQATSDTPFDDDASWTWNLQVLPGPHADLILAVVNVVHPGQGGLSSSSHQLSRLIRDPQVWIKAQQATTEEQQK